MFFSIICKDHSFMVLSLLSAVRLFISCNIDSNNKFLVCIHIVNNIKVIKFILVHICRHGCFMSVFCQIIRIHIWHNCVCNE